MAKLTKETCNCDAPFTHCTHGNKTLPRDLAMTYREACEYVERATEAQGEQFAEWGMGATSLGYNASEWAADYGGYRTASDPEFAKAQAVITAYNEAITVHYYFPGAVNYHADLGEGQDHANDDVPF